MGVRASSRGGALELLPRAGPPCPAPSPCPRGPGSGGAVTLPRQMWQVMGSVRDSVTLGPCCAMAGPERRGPAPAARKSRGRAGGPGPRQPRYGSRRGQAAARSAARPWRAGGSRGPSRLCSAAAPPEEVSRGSMEVSACARHSWGEARRRGERGHSACARRGRRGSKSDLLSPDKPVLCSGFIVLN